MIIVRRRNKLKWLAVALGVLLVAIGGWRLIVMLSVTKKTTTLNNPSQVITNSTDKPDEGPVKVADDYSVPADQPFKIKIPEINVDGYIQQVGTDQYGNIAVPSSIYVAGWYINSVKPGDDGLSIIDGHVHGVYKPGIFYDLKKLSIGSQIIITYGDGHTYTFKVKTVINIKNDEAANIIFAQDPAITSQLNLVTCGGKYDAGSRSYDSRVIVVSEKI